MFKWPGKPRKNIPGGSLKYLFVYLIVRIFKCSYRIYMLIMYDCMITFCEPQSLQNLAQNTKEPKELFDEVHLMFALLMDPQRKCPKILMSWTLFWRNVAGRFENSDSFRSICFGDLYMLYTMYYTYMRL